MTSYCWAPLWFQWQKYVDTPGVTTATQLLQEGLFGKPFDQTWESFYFIFWPWYFLYNFQRMVLERSMSLQSLAPRSLPQPTRHFLFFFWGVVVAFPSPLPGRWATRTWTSRPWAPPSWTRATGRGHSWSGEPHTYHTRDLFLFFCYLESYKSW